ncbi:MAG: LamG domain-containing protein, partial [Desulfobacterales bacterium]
LITMALLFCTPPVFAAGFVGSKDIGGGSYNYSGPKAMGMIVDAPDTISIGEMSAHVQGLSTATEIRGVVYVSNGADWDFVAATDVSTISVGWNLLSFASPVELISGETYLLAHITNGSRFLAYSGTGGGRVWNGSVDFYNPEGSGSQPVQIAYHYATWAPYGDSTAEGVPGAEEEPVAVDINDGLIAYFPFEGNADDMSGNGNGGAEVGVVSYEAGAVGKAATFGGEGFIIADGEPFALTEWTISFWIYVDEAPPQYWYSPVTKQAATTAGDAGNYNYAFTYWYNGWFNSQYEDSSGNNADHTMNTGQTMPPGQWHHIVSTRSASGDYRIYLDGILGNSSYGSDVPTIESPDTPFLVGGKVTDTTLLFKGQIDELRVYGTAHDAGFVQELYDLSEVTSGAECPVSEPEIVEVETIVEVPVETIVYVESGSCVDGLCNVEGLTLDELSQMEDDLKAMIRNLKECRVNVVHAIDNAKKEASGGKGKGK